jgi:meiotically up-regulated gene 157 (Mug157) protein
VARAAAGSNRLGEVLAETWRALPIDSELGLLASEEDPADDPASMPYLLSTQILLWYTATRLLIHAGELRLDAPALAGAADTVRAAIRDRFPCPGPFGTQWTYETDGRGRFRRYQDANDLPTALAPLWGLCAPEVLGETGRAGRVLERLLAVAAPDGLLPETYDSDTGAWLARHWFAWPSAVLAALALGPADLAEQKVRP